MSASHGASRAAPVVAILPFRGDVALRDNAALSILVGEALIGELTRFGGIEVIAAQSAAAVGDLPENEAAARLGADYVLTGRLAALGTVLRAAVTLVAASDATPVWHENLEIDSDDPLGVIDEVTARLAATFSAQVFGDVLRRSRIRTPETLADFEIVARGIALLKYGTRQSDEQARELFEQILDRDPQSSAALGGIALSWFNEWSCDFWGEFEEIGRRAYDYAHRALAIDDRNPWLHLVVGRILLYRREFARASWYIDRAVALAPNDAELLIQLVPAEVYLGRPEAALAHAEKATRLNPYHPNYYYAYAAFPPFVMGDFEQALKTAERAAGVMIIDIPAFSAMACAHLGQWDKARRFLTLFDTEFRRRITHGREPEPGEAFEWLVAYNPFRREEDIALVAEGCRLLGGSVLHRPAAPRAGAGAASEAALSREGAGWWVDFEGVRSALPDLKGLHDLVRLLARPGEEFHCLDLAGREDDDAGEAVLDERGRQALKLRIRELQEELAEAEDMNDVGHAETLRTELDRLVEGLSRALGIGGRRRRMGDLAERARSSVTWRIRHAIRRVGKVHPALGRHLSNSVRTGLFCSYVPEREIKWRITHRAGQ
ncbi:hypothetical protein H0Z60_02405 [Ectothiorhodospiraceae bacterium WFHF3C12]|nr:hypothetical protein [Ectothiorhodospiraceae bacterium WFHF3C12]